MANRPSCWIGILGLCICAGVGVAASVLQPNPSRAKLDTALRLSVLGLAAVLVAYGYSRDDVGNLVGGTLIALLSLVILP